MLKDEVKTLSAAKLPLSPDICEKSLSQPLLLCHKYSSGLGTHSQGEEITGKEAEERDEFLVTA